MDDLANLEALPSSVHEDQLDRLADSGKWGSVFQVGGPPLIAPNLQRPCRADWRPAALFDVQVGAWLLV